MKNTVFCQSCGMPLEKPEDFGTEKNGEKSLEYCRYCYGNGEFDKDETMEEMIESCIPFAIEGGVYKTADEAREAMNKFFPTLKRWAKA